MAWFYLHCVLALVMIVTDANGTLEPAVNKFEQMVGLYTPPPEDQGVALPAIEKEFIDSTFILPPHLQRDNYESE